MVLNGLILLPTIAAFLNQPTLGERPKAKPADKKGVPSGFEEHDPLPFKPFITAYRGTMMIITCVCILAVDFKVFPRRFAKVETWGTSLMDLGVGSFVFSAGVISVRKQLKEPNFSFGAFLQSLNDAIRHSLPLMALGFVRLYSVKGLDYQEHVTEYGVHWNFFFTLALIPPAVAFFQPLFKLIPSYAILGFALSVTYEAVLCNSNLPHFILTAPRVDWLSQNREGVFSFIGYLAIFLIGQGTGMNILPRDEETTRALSEEEEWLSAVLAPGQEVKKPVTDRPDRLASIIQLAKWSGIWCVVYYFSCGSAKYGPRLLLSRRLANEPYVVWIAAANCLLLTLFCAIEQLVWPTLYKSKDPAVEREKIAKATSKVLQAFNRNGLAIFLLANLLTGLINMTMNTLEMGDVATMAVLMVYLGTLAGVGLLLNRYNVSIKL